MHAVIRSTIQVTRLQGTSAGWNLPNFPSLKLDFSFWTIPGVVSLLEWPGGTNYIIYWIGMQTWQRYEWGAAATNKCWAALLRAASEKIREKWKREWNLLSRFSSVHTEWAQPCKMCLVWAQSLLWLVKSRWGDIRWQIPIGPLRGRGGWGTTGSRKVESLSSSLLQVVQQHMRLDM